MIILPPVSGASGDPFALAPRTQAVPVEAGTDSSVTGDIARRPGALPALPNAAEVYKGTTNAAGVPILELVRKMEYEKLLSRDDRLALNAALYNPDKREQIIEAIKNVELGMNSRFAIRRLKALIHGNSAGEPGIHFRSMSSPDHALSGSRRLERSLDRDADQPQLSPKKAKVKVEVADEQSVVTQDTASALQRVLGDAPTYSNISSGNVCHKIGKNLHHYLSKVQAGKTRPRQLAVIVGNGSYNPLTRMHLRTFFVAKQYLEKYHRVEVLGALLSPAHASLVRLRYRTCSSEIIPTAHRLAIAQLCVQDSRFVTVDPWEVTRRCAMDYLSQLDHVQAMLSSHFPQVSIKLFYLCKSNFVPKLSIEG
jgi:hypothetical protein